MNTNEVSDSEITNIQSTRKLASILKINVDELRSVAKIANNFYQPFIKKKPKERKIDNPIGRLKIIQNAINEKILKKIKLPDTILGGVSGKSIKDNASFHINQPIVVTIDIKKCFPNTKSTSVFKLFRNYFGYSTINSNLLTKLTTRNDYVPQGSPCSSSIVNLCLLPLHNDFQKLVKKHNLVCTTWVDDITISGENADKFVNEYIKILKKYKYQTQCKKVKIMKNNRNQEVTGIIVNNKTSVPKKKISEIKALIYYIRKYEIQNEFSKFHEELKGKMGYVKYINIKQFDRLYKFINKCGIKI